MPPPVLHNPGVSNHSNSNHGVREAHPFGDVVVSGGGVEEGESEGREEESDAEPVEECTLRSEPNLCYSRGTRSSQLHRARLTLKGAPRRRPATHLGLNLGRISAESLQTIIGSSSGSAVGRWYGLVSL